MRFEKPTVETWEMMREIKAAIGSSAVQRIFSVGQTQINRYCRDPKYTSDSERNPLDRVRLLLAEAQEAGAGDTVLSALAHILAPLGYSLVIDQPKPDKSTSREEAADDLTLVARRDAAMAADDLPCVVSTLTTAICSEARETSALYEKEWNERNGA